MKLVCFTLLGGISLLATTGIPAIAAGFLAGASNTPIAGLPNAGASHTPQNLLAVTSPAVLPNFSSDTYYFTVTLPANSSFTRLSLTEIAPGISTTSLQFDPTRVQVFTGNPNTIGNPIGASGWVDETGTFWVEFSNPVPAETTLTVAFQAQRPPANNVYEFGVAAYPTANNSGAVFVGNGLLTIE